MEQSKRMQELSRVLICKKIFLFLFQFECYENNFIFFILLKGNYIIDSLNTGFVSKLSKGDHTVHLEYRSPSPLTGQANNPENIWQDNRYLCALILNGNLKFHRNNHQGPLSFAKTAVWTALNELQSKFTVEIDRPVLFFYNIAGHSQDYFGGRLLVDGTAVKSTYKRVPASPYLGLFGMGAKILRQGEHTVSFEYVAGIGFFIKFKFFEKKFI